MRQRSSLVVVIGLVLNAIVLAGCTVANPLYSPEPTTNDGAASYDFSSSTQDLATQSTQDLAMMTSPPACSAGPRTCAPNGSLVCTNGQYVLDRMCPAGSTCAAGYCAAPPLGRACAVGQDVSETLCSGFMTSADTCQPFVQSNGAVTWDCDTPVGKGEAGSVCTLYTECASGVCATDHTCFRACTNDNDCPKTGSAKKCATEQFVVEGVMLSARGCVN